MLSDPILHDNANVAKLAPIRIVVRTCALRGPPNLAFAPRPSRAQLVFVEMSIDPVLYAVNGVCVASFAANMFGKVHQA